MKTNVAVFASLLLSAGLVGAQPAAPGGRQPPPVFKIVFSIDKTKAQVAFFETTERMVPVETEQVVIKNGQTVREKVITFQKVIHQQVNTIDLALARVITADGKQLPLDQVWKHVKAGTVVVVSANAETPAVDYLRALNPQTIVIIPPAPKPAPAPKQP